MVRTIEVWSEGVRQEDGWSTAAAAVELPDRPRTRLWFRALVPAGWRLSPNADTFVVALLLTAMRERAPLRVHGEVSPSLLRNLEEFQAVWSRWQPERYRRVEIVADRELEQPAAATGAVSAFSGGVDSCFTVFRHATGRAGRQAQTLRAGMIVHGFEIALDDGAGFEGAAAKAEAMLADLGLDLVRMATNVRDFSQNWRYGKRSLPPR